MKNQITFILLMVGLITTQTFAQSQLEVVVKNVKETKGTVRVGIFKDDKTFLKETWIGKVVKAKAGEVKVIFENVPAGKYAVSIIHDENENGDLDSNLFGIPKEGFGFSNDAMGMFGPPDFAKASFTVTNENISLGINMRYM